MYLRDLGLLTKGGLGNLEIGLKGRNNVVSLGLQDVRSWAHGLVEELIPQLSCKEMWESTTSVYTQSFDRGKPRRPTHLQRLYLEWSSDYSWPGLIRACKTHPQLWTQLQVALERLEDRDPEYEILDLALRCQNSLDPWVSKFEGDPSLRGALLVLLPLLNLATPARRVSFLAELASGSSIPPVLASAVIKATLCSFAEAKVLAKHEFNRVVLEKLGLSLMEQYQEEFVDPYLVASFRSFITSEKARERLLKSIPVDDPIRKVNFGSRPGTSWLACLADEMGQIIWLL